MCHHIVKFAYVAEALLWIMLVGQQDWVSCPKKKLAATILISFRGSDLTPGQLSLAIPPWVGAMSTSESWDVNRHTE